MIRTRKSTNSALVRHGTLSLYGALNTQTGEVLAKTSARQSGIIDHDARCIMDLSARACDLALRCVVAA
jgi:hypothetical protein